MPPCASSSWTTSAPCASRCGVRSSSRATTSSSPPTAAGARRLGRGEQAPDAVVLDVLMPGVDGLEVCRRLRAPGDRMPDPDADRARTRSTTASPASTPAPTTTWSSRSRSRSCSPASARSCAGRPSDRARPLALRRPRRSTRTRARSGAAASRSSSRAPSSSLLELFLRNPRQVLTRSLIFERVWGYDFGATSNSLDVYVGYLRRKTEADGEPRLIHTVRGVGYVLREAMSFRARDRARPPPWPSPWRSRSPRSSSTSSVRSQLRGQVDDALADRAEIVERSPHRRGATSEDQFFLAHPGPGAWAGRGGYVQLVGPPGRDPRARGRSGAPGRTSDARASRPANGGSSYSDARRRRHPRARLRPRRAAAATPSRSRGRSTEVDDTLDRLRTILILVALGGHRARRRRSACVVARTALAPVRRLTEATEEVAADPRPVPAHRRTRATDELGRLAGELQHHARRPRGRRRGGAAPARRRRLARAADAARPACARTSRCSRAADDCRPRSGERLLADVVEQLDGAERARGRARRRSTGSSDAGEPEDVRLDLARRRGDRACAANAAASRSCPTSRRPSSAACPARSSARSPTCSTTRPSGARPAARSRSPSATARSPSATTGRASTRTTCPYVFDRFYRAAAARGQPGSGLGLAIVRQVAEAHGGPVTAERAHGGGTLVRLRLLPGS